jgi:hypothetical protein
MRSQIKHRIAVGFKVLNPNYISFLAGIIVSAAIEIYFNMLWADKVVRPSGVLASSALLLLSSILLMRLSLHLQSLYEPIVQAPKVLGPGEREAIHLELITQSLGQLVIHALLSIATASIGMLLLWFALS